MESGPRLLWCEARLTNHAELVAELGLDPGAGDTGVVKAAVARWGDNAPHYLLGGIRLRRGHAGGASGEP